MNKREMHTVVEDLEYIESRWMLNPGDQELRRGSAILRRLLIDGALERCWRAVGMRGELNITAPNIDSIMAKQSSEGGRVVLLVALGARYRGAEVAAIFLHIAHEGQKANPPNVGESGPPYSRYTIRKYLISSSGIQQEEDDKHPGGLKTTTISRADVIKYVANNLGGVHIGPSSHTKGRRVAERVSKFEGTMNILDKDPIFFEILAIGQRLVQSPDVKTMIQKVRGTHA